ncbi:MAG: hypothetical protein V3V85_04180 [Candidatus Thorarchaeota archaeon]
MSKLKDKQNVYKLTFGSETGKDVLSDLRTFCYATKTTRITDVNGRVDKDAMLIMEGRREVFLQIMAMMKVNFSEVYDYESEVDF